MAPLCEWINARAKRLNWSIHVYEAFIFELILAMPNIIFLLYTYSLGTLTICSPLACRNTSLGALTICSSLAGRNTWSLRRRRQARDLRVPSQWEPARRIQGPLFRCCHCNRRATMYVLYCRSIQFVMLCLHERLFGLFVARHLTGDDGRHPNRCRGGCRLKWNMSQFLLRSDTVIYEAATQRPVDELFLTFYLANRHWSLSSSCMHYHYAFVISSLLLD